MLLFISNNLYTTAAYGMILEVTLIGEFVRETLLLYVYYIAHAVRCEDIEFGLGKLDRIEWLVML